MDYGDTDIYFILWGKTQDYIIYFVFQLSHLGALSVGFSVPLPYSCFVVVVLSTPLLSGFSRYSTLLYILSQSYNQVFLQGALVSSVGEWH